MQRSLTLLLSQATLAAGVRSVAATRHNDRAAGGMMRAYRGRRGVLAVAVVLLIAAYAASRLYALSALPIFFDEGNYAASAMLIGRAPLHTDPFTVLTYWGVPPLFTWVAAPFTRLMTDPLLACRIAAGAVGLVGLAGVWLCGRSIGSARVALLASTLYVACPFLLLYHRMAMVDGLLTAIGAFALLAAMRLARAPNARTALVLGLCLALAVFTKITGPLLLALPVAVIAAADGAARRRAVRAVAPALLCGSAAVLALLFAPGGVSMIAVAHQHQRIAAPFLDQTLAQVSTIGQSLWLYMTPPVLLLALMGARGAWRDPAMRVLILWTASSLAPFAVIHLAFSPRYILPATVPVLLLAAQGAAALLGSAGKALAARRGAGLALLALAIILCCGQDAPLIADPARASFLPVDRQQYVSGWPAGYALARALRRAHGLAHGRPMTLVSSLQNPPGDALAVLVGREPRVRLVYRDFARLDRPGLLASPGRAVFVVVCRPTGQRISARRAGLRLAARIANGDGVGSVDLYAPSG